MNALELKIPPLLLTLVFALIIYGLYLIYGGQTASQGPAMLVAACLLLAAVCTMLIGVWHFYRAGTTIDPTHPAEARQLVTRGIYSFTRNPMYLGMLLVLLAESCYLWFWPGLFVSVGFVLYMNRFQIEPEERFLFEHFGQNYLDYKSKVRRWL